MWNLSKPMLAGKINHFCPCPIFADFWAGCSWANPDGGNKSQRKAPLTSPSDTSLEELPKERLDTQSVSGKRTFLISKAFLGCQASSISWILFQQQMTILHNSSRVLNAPCSYSCNSLSCPLKKNIVLLLFSCPLLGPSADGVCFLLLQKWLF